MDDKPLLAIGYILLGIILLLSATQSEASDYDGERFCLAQNIYFESGNQSFAGKLAVGDVVMNRVEDEQFPNSVCDVIYQAKTFINWKGKEMPIRNQCQFSWYCDGRSDQPTDSVTWLESIKVADLILRGDFEDITEGSLWYHADYVKPNWSNYLEEVVIIDNHIFYK